MSVNKNRPHVFVLPEDDANRQLADAFHQEVDWTRYRQMQVLPEVGGGEVVLRRFQEDHIKGLERYEQRFMVLLIDFDGEVDKLAKAKDVIPDHLKDRVFVLGTLNEPEDLRKKLGDYKTIGSALAQDCRKETDTTWGHPHLQHNASELARLREHVCPILFSSV